MHRQDAYAPSDVPLLVAPEYAYLSTILVCPFVRLLEYRTQRLEDAETQNRNEGR